MEQFPPTSDEMEKRRPERFFKRCLCCLVVSCALMFIQCLYMFKLRGWGDVGSKLEGRFKEWLSWV